MSTFRTWIRKKTLSAHDSSNSLEVSEPALPSGLPVLPPKRQRVLTPSSSHENIIQNIPTQSPFFQRLPLELRRQIYIFAFGGRTVHMDLRFDYPQLPGSPHAPSNVEYTRLQDNTVRAGWIWWSSVCHRNPVLEGWEDGCRTGSANTTCFLYPGKMPEKCYLGVLGWLMACRQS